MRSMICVAIAGAGLLAARQARAAEGAGRPAPRAVDLRAPDGTLLRATWFAAAGPGPGALLLHQVNRTRRSWDDVAARLAAAGIHALTLDLRGHGESGGTPYEKLSKEELGRHWRGWPGDVDAALGWVASQPGVERGAIGIGGAGLLGVDSAILAAARHPAEVKSLVLISGETLRDGLEFLHRTSRLPGLFVVSDEDEYPPTAEAMELLYASSANPGKRLVHYAAAKDAPWIWYEPADVGRVLARGHHGTDLFATHPELPGIVVEWLLTTLVRTPGHAPPDGVAAAPVLEEIEWDHGAARVKQRLLEARREDPGVQLFPEIAVSIIGQDFLRAGDVASAVEVFQLNLLAFPGSADALANLADAQLKSGQPVLARPLAEKALALLDARATPASSWSDTEEQRGEIRKSALRTLRQVPGAVFRDCPACPEMVTIPAGTFTMGSTEAEREWAANHGARLAWVADEAPPHAVTLRSFALGRYNVTRGEYAAFARATGHPAGDGCGHDGEKWVKQPGVTWESPGFPQTDRDPVVCVSWHDARAYLAWLDGKAGGGVYRLPSEAEWEYAARAGTSSRFYWGDDAGAAPDHAWFRQNAGARTHPVGAKGANAFGLSDMVGNVWQWTADCYAKSYAGAPVEGSAAQVGDAACLRVDRGGSWYYDAWLLRPATRERNPADYRDTVMGFRVARSLP